MKRDEILIEKSNCEVDPSVADAIIGELLVDEAVNLKNVYNDMVYRYLNGSEDFKAGADMVLTTITQYNLTEIAQKVLEAK